MKRIKGFFWILLWLIISLPVKGQFESQKLSGTWMGSLNAGSSSLRLVFNITVEEDSSLSATMDSPDQGATGIPMGEVSVLDDSLRIEAPMLQGYYVGKISSSDSILGEWHQAGRFFELYLKKLEGAFTLLRPQEPRPPFPYKEEQVQFKQKSEGFTLGGTLTVPEGEGPFPSVVLVSGSGSQNRDEEIFGHKPFWVMADHLSRKGIAVLRYDDRGVGASGGTASGATSADHAIDARSAVEFLLSRNEFDPAKIGIVGHSEGGMIAFMLAAEHKDISFIVSLAGPGVDGKTILLEQSEYISRLSGVSASIIEDNLIVMEEAYDLLMSNESHQSWGEELIEFASRFYSSKTAQQYSDEQIERGKNNLLNSIPPASYAWMRYFVMFDPAPLFPSIECPVLALNGGKDSQVLAEKNINAIKEGMLRSGNKEVTTMILPGLNHLFQNCESGLPGEYNQIEETFDPTALELISGWILQLQ